MHGEQRLLMMRHLHPVARGMRGDTPPFGDPASQGDVGVEDIDRASLDQVTATPALHLALPSRDPHAGGSPHLTHATHLVVPVHRLLKPGDVTVGHATRKGDRLCNGVAHVRIAGDNKIVTDGLAHLPYARNICLWQSPTDLEFHPGVACLTIFEDLLDEPLRALALCIIATNDDGLQPCLRRSQEAEDRHPCLPPNHVPQDYIERREGSHHGMPSRRDRGAPKILLPDGRHLTGLTPKHARKQLLPQDAAHYRLLVPFITNIDLPPYSLCCPHPQQQCTPAVHRVRPTIKRPRQRHLEWNHLRPFNPHYVSPSRATFPPPVKSPMDSATPDCALPTSRLPLP